ncbi:MAG TPA: cache domain-containing protein, partial [Magnetospirillum sp.]|nr:cache domain-containing protein [Magnetospirillum sp.]
MKIEQLSPPVHTAKRRRSPWSAYRVALIVIAGLVASVGAHLKVTYDKAIRDAETLISALAIASEQHIGGSLAGIDALLDELAANVREGRHTDTHFSNDFAARLPSYPEVKYIGIVNADGVLQPDTWPPRPLPLSPEGVNVSANKYFTAQRDSKGPARMVFGDPVAGPAEDGRSLYLSRPIRDRSGRFVGVAVASVDPDAYATFLSSILYDENGACALIG